MDTESFSLRDAAAILWARKWLVIAISAAGFATAVAVTLLTTPTYRVKATLVPSESSTDGLLGSLLGSFGGLPSMMGMGSLAQDYTTEALALFESRQFIQKFIADENLQPRLFPKLWDPVAKDWKVPPEKRPTLWKSYDAFMDRFRAFKNRKSGLVTVEMDWTDPHEAARLVNGIVARVNQDMRARAMEETALTIDYLQKEVEAARTLELQRTIYSMIESQIKMNAVASARQQFAFKVLDPALAPDADERIKPKPVLYVIGGVILGGMLGVVVALLLGMDAATKAAGDASRRRVALES